MRAAHPVCCSAAGIKKSLTEMTQGIDFILYVCDIFFIPHPVLYILLLWNYELSGVKIAIYLRGWGLIFMGAFCILPKLPGFLAVQNNKKFYETILGR